MDTASVQAAYSRWSKFYDGTFGVLMRGARRRAYAILDLQAGESALEVGVGTGLSLSLMPDGCRLTGVDFSRPMLERALPRVRHGKLRCRAALVEADGARLPFADGTFDAAIAPFRTDTDQPDQKISARRWTGENGGCFACGRPITRGGGSRERQSSWTVFLNRGWRADWER